MKVTIRVKKALASGKPVPLTIAGTQCVLVRRDVFERDYPAAEYADGTWTTDELDALAAEAAERLDQMPKIP